MSTDKAPLCCGQPMRWTKYGYECRKCGYCAGITPSGLHPWQGDVANMEARRLERIRRRRERGEI